MLENTSGFRFDEQVVAGGRLDDAELKLTIYAAPPPAEHG